MRKPENQCQGKNAYMSKAAARDSVANLNKSNGKHRVKAYKCSTCGSIHIGHDSKRTMLDKSKKVEGYVHKSKRHIVNIDKIKNNGRSAES